MVSFYVGTPGGFDIELGWDGLRVSEDGYTAEAERGVQERVRATTARLERVIDIAPPAPRSQTW